MARLSGRSAALAILISLTAGLAVVYLVLALSGDSQRKEPVVGEPEPAGSPGTPPPDSRCPVLREESPDAPVMFLRVGEGGGGDIIGDGRPSLATVWADENRPPRCRYYLVLAHPGGTTWAAPIKALSWLPVAPSILMSVEIDGEPGLEIVLDFGGPGHPHRTGQIFTFQGSLNRGSLVRMHVQAPPSFVPFLFALNDEFVGAVDCGGEPGTIVITEGSFADEGNDDSHYDIERTFYRAVGATFVELHKDTYTVGVGDEKELWPETADDSFRSCSAG